MRESSDTNWQQDVRYNLHRAQDERSLYPRIRRVQWVAALGWLLAIVGWLIVVAQRLGS